MTDNDPLVQELRAQLQGTMEENQELRLMVAQRDRWITELRSTVAALLGNTPYPLHIRPSTSENLRRRG